MKLDRLRSQLRKSRKPKKTIARPKLTAPFVPGKCSKCGKKREVAKLTDPDVAQIIKQSEGQGTVRHAVRCRTCSIIWTVGDPPPKHMPPHKDVKPRSGPGEACSLCGLRIPDTDGPHFFSGFTMCEKCATSIGAGPTT